MTQKHISKELKDIFERYQKSVYFEHHKVVDVNSRGLDDRPLLNIAISYEDSHAVRVVLEGGAEPNILGDMSYTPLHEAVYCSNKDAIALLLRYGADRNLKSEFGQTAYDLAIQRGETALLPLLGR